MMRWVAAVSFVALVVSSATLADEMLTTKQIMGKLNKGPKSLMATIGKELKKADPDWDDVQKRTKEFAELAAAMTKNQPSRGEKESWEKLSKAYCVCAKALDEAVQNKDLKAAKAAHAKLGGSCKACHDAHRSKS